MKHRGNHMRTAVLTGIALLMLTCSVQADQNGQANLDQAHYDVPSAGAMVFDLILVRPVSLVATVLGTGLFILNLPLSVFEKNAPAQPFHQLVVEPARYTFTRPLGALN